MGHDLGKLGLRVAVLLSPDQVAWTLLGISVGDECRDGDQVTISRGELGTRPHIAEQHIVCELCQLWGKSPMSC